MQRIIDSHFHIWDPSVQPLSWLDGTDGPSPAVTTWTASNAPMPHTMSNTQTLRLISSAVCMWKSTRTIRHWKIGCCPKTMILCCWQHLCGPPSDRPCACRCTRMAFVSHCIRRHRRGDGACKMTSSAVCSLWPIRTCHSTHAYGWMNLTISLRLVSRCPKQPSSLTIWATYSIFTISNPHPMPCIGSESCQTCTSRYRGIQPMTHDSSQPCSISHKPRSRTSGCCTRQLACRCLYADFDSHLSILLNRFAGDDDFFLNNARNAYHIVERKIS